MSDYNPFLQPPVQRVYQPFPMGPVGSTLRPSQAVVPSPYGLRQLGAGAGIPTGGVQYGPSAATAAQRAAAGLYGNLPYAAADDVSRGAGGLAGRLAGASIQGAGALPYVTGAGRAAGRGAGLASALGKVKSPGGGAWGTATGIGGKVGALGKGLGPLSAGMAGGAVIEALSPGGENSNWESGLKGAAQGAGVGAAIGAIGLPIPVVGEITTGGGALIGGAIGGLLGVFGGGGDEDKQKDFAQLIDTAGSQAGLDSTTISEFKAYYNVMAELGGGTKEAKQAAAAEVGQMLLAEMQGRKQMEDEAAFNLATQQQTADFIAPYYQDMLRNAGTSADLISQMAGSLPPSIANTIRAGQVDNLSAVSRLGAAYAAQAGLSGQAAILDKQQQLIQGTAGSLVQQGIQGAMTGGGGGSMEDLLAQLGG